MPVLTPLLFALVIAPALANTIATPAGRTTYMTYVALATAGLLIPLNCMFSGLGVIVDRQQGAMRELLVAPGPPIVDRGRQSGRGPGHHRAPAGRPDRRLGLAGSGLCDEPSRALVHRRRACCSPMLMYGMAEVLATRLPSPEEYIGVVPVGGHRPVLLRRNVVPDHGAAPLARRRRQGAAPDPRPRPLPIRPDRPQRCRSLHNIWGMSNVTVMASLSLLVVGLYALVIFTRGDPPVHQGRHQLMPVLGTALSVTGARVRGFRRHR